MEHKIGPYTVESVKEGGMGVIFFVNTGQEKFVLKTIRPELMAIPEVREAFKREAELWILLSAHPNVTAAYKIIEINDKLYILAERIEPKNKFNCVSVADWLLYRSFWPLETVRYAIQGCRAMHWAQKNMPGFIHRDIKPANLLLDGVNAKVNDFGLGGIAYAAACSETAKTAAARFHERAGLTIWGKKAVGTTGYMAPEVLKEEGATVCSDIYSFGVTLYEMCSGAPLFRGTPEEINKAHLSKSPLPLRKIRPDIPADAEAVIMRCLSKHPKERFGDFREIGEQLQKIYSRLSGSALPKEPPRSEADFLQGHVDSLRKIGKGFSAYKLVEKAKNQAEYSGESCYRKADVLYNEGQYQEAIVWYDEALKKGVFLNDRIISIWLNKGCALGGLKKYKEAILCFEEAVKINSQHVFLAWYNKGVALRQLTMHQEAIACYDKAIELNPKHYNAWYEKSELLNQMNRHEEALRCVDEAIKLNSESTSGHRLRQLILEAARAQDSSKFYCERCGREISYLEHRYQGGLCQECAECSCMG